MPRKLTARQNVAALVARYGTQKAAAEAVGIPALTLSRIASGETKKPRKAKLLAKIRDLLK